MGKVQQNYPVLDSTNSYAAELLSKTSPSEGTVIVAANQLNGRGQYGSKWHAEAGQNLTLSYILYPRFLALSAQFDLNIAVCLACKQAIEHFIGLQVKIKWPNDIYVGSRKIGGILIQNQVQSTQIKSSVIGIGLNVNQIEFPEDLPNPTSLRQINNQVLDHQQLIDVLSYFLEQEYLKLRQGNFLSRQLAYVENLYGFGQIFRFRDAEQLPFEGCIIGVDPEGRLQIEIAGNKRTFGIKEIQFLGQWGQA